MLLIVAVVIRDDVDNGGEDFTIIITSFKCERNLEKEAYRL